MKKYLIALLLGIGMMAMQTASAATLSLTSEDSGVTINGGSVTTTGTATFNLNIIGNDGELVDLLFSYTGGNGFILPGGTTGLEAGEDYELTVFGPSTFEVSIIDGVVPVPAAVWLFGSALAGLFGVSRRKSAPALAV